MSENAIIAIINAVVSIVSLLITLLIKKGQVENKVKFTQMKEEIKENFGSQILNLGEKVHGTLSSISEKVEGNSTKIEEAQHLPASVKREVGKVKHIPNPDSRIMILVIDDSMDDLYMIKRVIEKIGGLTYTLYNNEVELVQELTPEPKIYIIDHFLERMTGLDVLEEIKKMNEDNFVIGYTGTQDKQLIINYANSSIDRFIDKNNQDSEKHLIKYIKEGMVIIGSKQ